MFQFNEKVDAKEVKTVDKVGEIDDESFVTKTFD